jgi:pimeloyl-ACP methyl ester carboxylesterase
MTKTLISAAALALSPLSPAPRPRPPPQSRTSSSSMAASSTAPAGRASTISPEEKGYNVTIVQNPTTSLTDDVAFTKRAIAQQDGPVVLVGHSYGGVVVSEAGTDEKVKAVVYIAAFAPDKGESVSSLIANPPPGASVPPILPPVDGFLALDKAKFAASFAADVDARTAAFMADSQVPWAVEALTGAVTNPAWKVKPSFYLVATDDHMIPPPAQRQMAKRAGSTVVETKGSHAVYVSKPGDRTHRRRHHRKGR